MPQDAVDQVKDQVRKVGSDLKDAYAFKNQRKAVSDWWNDKVSQVKGYVNKLGSGTTVKAATTSKPTAPKATPAKKAASRKRTAKR